MYFSEAFEIADSDQYDWFDPILERDTLLFVDPFLIFKDKDERWSQAHDSMMDYFHNAFTLLAKSGLKPSHQFYRRTLTLMEFPEPTEFRLGFASKSANGSGNGPGLARQVVAAMGEAINRGLEDIEHFEELGILVAGIDKDRISDITCNLLKPQFIEYTQTACHSLGISMQPVEIAHSSFDDTRQRWISDEHLVPVDPRNGKPIILVPKRFLRELPTLGTSSWYDYLDETSLRDDLNLRISTKVRKHDIIAAARGSRERLRQWISMQEARKPEPYDVVSDPKLLVKWQKAASSALDEMGQPETLQIDGPEALMQFIHIVIERFRHWVEDQGGWRLFWKDIPSLESVPEPNMQLLLLGVIDGYCRRAKIRVDREVETGRGPVDFTFTGNHAIRVLLEIKKLTHGRFWNGLSVQTPIYMRGQSVDHAIFLVIRDSDSAPMRDRWKDLENEAEQVSGDVGLTIEIARIDALPKEPASKAATLPDS
jgi:hypothetical protein